MSDGCETEHEHEHEHEREPTHETRHEPKHEPTHERASRMDRRQFFSSSAAVAVTAASAGMLSGRSGLASPPDLPPRPKGLNTTLPVETLGRTRAVLPRLGLGCYPLSWIRNDQKAVQLILRAMDLGIRYFDTASSYGKGLSEYRLGLAIAASGLDREELFIATKCDERDAAGARQSLDDSLARLGLDYVDSIQVHNLQDDVMELFGPGQVLDGLQQARDEGLTRFIGITCHIADPSFLNYAIQHFQFDTILVPVNVLRLKYVEHTFPIAEAQNLGIVAMKLYQGGSLITERHFTPQQLVGFVLDTPGVDLVIPGLDTIEQLDEIAAFVAGSVSGYARRF